MLGWSLNLIEIGIVYSAMMIGGIFDSYSTIRLVGNTERTELNPTIEKSFHNKLGLRKGEYTKLILMTLLGFPLISAIFLHYFGLEYSLIIVSFYVGFYFRQFLTSIFTA